MTQRKREIEEHGWRMLGTPQVGARSGPLFPLLYVPVLFVFVFLLHFCLPLSARFVEVKASFQLARLLECLWHLISITCSIEGLHVTMCLCICVIVAVVMGVTYFCCLLLPASCMFKGCGAWWLLQDSSCCCRCLIPDRLLPKLCHGFLCTLRDFLSHLQPVSFSLSDFCCFCISCHADLYSRLPLQTFFLLLLKLTWINHLAFLQRRLLLYLISHFFSLQLSIQPPVRQRCPSVFQPCLIFFCPSSVWSY